jgi:glycyl-tRNA synthetase
MPDLMDDVVALAKRRGIAFQSSELYGGLRSSWDYGPLGVELRRNVREAWWRATVQLRHDVVGLEAAVIMSPRVWEASGHVATFHDPLVECLACHQRFRADHLEPNEDGVTLCPNCGNRAFTESRQFNMMLKTHLGPVEDDDAVTYLRPETAQGMFVDFAQVQTAFRNEITPGNFIFRTREFEQMEMEFFIEPGTDDDWFPYWVQQRLSWYTDLGIRPEKLRLRDHEPDELAHYAKAATDIEYEFPFGWQEIEGIANRTDYDLAAHQAASGEDLTYFDQEHDRRYLPWVVEPAAGVDRALLTFLVDAYRVEEAPTAKGGTEKRTYLALHRDLAPIKVAVLPLSRNETLTPTAREVFDLVKGDWMCDFDDAGSIGRRYRRQDEVGTPFCVTVDFDSIEDRAVTVRDRDTMVQERIPMVDLVDHLRGRL